MPLQPARSKGQVSFPAFRSFPLCYTAGRHEGARREPKVEFMTEPADRAVLLLQKVSELLLESRAIVQQLEVVPACESSADARRSNRVWHSRGRARRRTRFEDSTRLGRAQAI